MKNILISAALAVCSALLLTLASPGYGLWFLAYIALVPMLMAVRLSRLGFLTGWFFGFAYYLANIYWIITAVSVLGEAPLAAGIVSFVVFSAFLGLFWGVFGWLYGRKKEAALLCAGIIVALEVAKSTMLTGFPMLNLAHTQYSFPAAIQTAEITGEFGISFIIAYVNTAFAALIADKNRRQAMLAFLVLGASFTYGYMLSDREYAGEPLRARIIQPAYPQAEKWMPEKKYDIMAVVNQMVRETDAENFDLLVLPETVYPAFMDDSFAGYHMLDLFGEKLPVMAGGIRRISGDSGNIYKNSILLFDRGEVQLYDKLHLVPFGEYFPFKTFFKPINYYFFNDAEDYTPGDAPVVFARDKFTAAPMICYESMYSSLVRTQVMMGADVLTLVTNDSWFGDSKGPYQHLAADVLRAVEFRKPVIRAAQSGISACIAPTGEIISELGLGIKGTVDCRLTTHKGLTVFATGGYGWLALLLIASWFASRKKVRK
jgi:apolipoprotein N-acyltransferase